MPRSHFMIQNRHSQKRKLEDFARNELDFVTLVYFMQRFCVDLVSLKENNISLGKFIASNVFVISDHTRIYVTLKFLVQHIRGNVSSFMGSRSGRNPRPPQHPDCAARYLRFNRIYDYCRGLGLAASLWEAMGSERGLRPRGPGGARPRPPLCEIKPKVMAVSAGEEFLLIFYYQSRFCAALFRNTPAKRLYIMYGRNFLRFFLFYIFARFGQI